MSQENIHELQQRLTHALSLPDDARQENAAINPQGFTVFDEAQLQKALAFTQEFMTIANSHHDRPLGAVLDRVEVLLRDDINDNETVRHGLMVFLTHHPIAQASGLKLPSLAARAPSLVVPVHSSQKAPDGQDSEVELNYFREDVNLNEHHEHWHIVYPGGGIPNPRNPSKLAPKDRQGELFVWMHQQMIARYNAERISNGFQPVKPLIDFLSDSLEPDVPDANLRWRGKAFTPRKAGLHMTDLGHKGQKDYWPVATLATWRDRLLEAIKSGKWRDGTPITPDSLGSTLEANVSAVDRSYYGNLHNMGHVIIAYLGNPGGWQDPNVSPGLMYETRTAVRDPVFWRWHGLIDELFATWQNTLPPLEFNDIPPVTFKKTGAVSNDIILVYTDVLQAAGVNVNDEAALEAWGEKTFGGANFDKDPDAKFATSVIDTEMRRRKFTNVGDDGATEEIEYLYPREWVYFFRVSNTSNKDLDVTFRVNIAPAATAEDRRAYFELDKFQTKVSAGAKKVVARKCDQSSVIRKPAQKTVEQMDDRRDEDDGLDRTGDQYCDCGWPFNLIIPRGKAEGLPFKLSVLVTDWNLDKVPTNKGCGSMSFCGAKEKYPDIREMGYPFTRRFNGSIADTVARVNSWAAKDISIKFNTSGFKTGVNTATTVTQPTLVTPQIIGGKTVSPNPITPAPQQPAAPPQSAVGGDLSIALEKLPNGDDVEIQNEVWPDHTIERRTQKSGGKVVKTTEKVVRTHPNGDIVTTTTETLPNGTKKVTKSTRSFVPKGQPGPFDKNATAAPVKVVKTDEHGRKIEETTTIENGVRKVTRRVLPQ